MKINLNIYRDRIYSQFGEDGITLKIFELIGTTNKIAVEIGTENGNECCSRVLRERLGFSCILFDDKNERPEINLNRATVTVDNVIGLLEEKSIPKDLDFLCVDVDGYDFYLLHRILQRYTPRIIVVETNPFFRLEDKVTDINFPLNTNINHNAYFGAGLVAWYNSLQSNYDLVCHENNGINAFFVLKGLIDSENLNKPTLLYKEHSQIYNFHPYPDNFPIVTSQQALTLLNEYKYSNSK